MTLRHRISSYALALAVSFGAVAAVPALTAPAAAEAPALRDDPLARTAAAALTQITGYLQTGSEAIRDEYNAARHTLAAQVAYRLGLDAVELEDAWRSADPAHQQALMAALSQLGVPYRRNTSKEGAGFDCSGLTTYAWGGAGIDIVRQSGSQIKNAAPRTRETAQAGDLVQYPGHVMMYLGVGDAIVHSPYTGRTVEVTFITAKRASSVRWGDPVG